MRILFGMATIFILASSARAASFHWVDREGFHSVDQVTKVPLEHRKDLPMARNRTALPFTEEEDRDGAMYVWFIFGRSGLYYSYLPARDFPESPFFRKVEEQQTANVAWWKGFVAFSEGSKGVLLSARGEVSLKETVKKRGRVTWYRYEGAPAAQQAPVAKKAPKAALRAGDTVLAGLDGAATFTPQVTDDAELDHLKKEWQKAVGSLEALRKKYPDDPQVLRRLGVCYRMGYNLGMPGAWDRAEAYLLRTEELVPEAPEAYISLGILYDDTDIDHAEQAEGQFRTALRNARKEQLPQIWWGLALALNYQGKVKEAVETIDRLLATYPEDKKAKNLRETFLEAGKKN
jgi:tetratricopeptide (TPR) repeat protein